MMNFKNDIEKFEFFESVLNNNLADDQKEIFNQELANNPQLAKEFEDYQSVFELVVDNSVLDVKEELRAVHNKFNGNQGTSGSKGGFWNLNTILFTIIGAVIISGVIFFVTSKEESNIPQVLANEEQEVVENETILVSEEVEETKEEVENIQESVKEETGIEAKEETPKQEENIKPEEEEKSAHVVSPENMEEEPIKNDSKPQEILPANLPENNLAEKNKETEPVVEEEIPSVDCDKINIDCDFTALKSCVENVSGEIIIDKYSLAGGLAPYNISINGGRDYYESRFVFSSLRAGIYSLFVKDDNECEKEIAAIEIQEKICIKDYKYSPEYGELWNIPLEGDKNGVFRLFSKNGQILVEKDINDYSDNTWDGKDDNGIQLNMDYYPFVIQYADGEVFKGSVTLFK